MSILVFGDFELDEARFELRHSGQTVTVQPKVLDLILYLARNRSRVVTKLELFDKVWSGVAVTDASLSQAVSLARRAVGDTPGAQHTLRTVWSKGFQFVAAVREKAGGGGRPSRPIGSAPAPAERRRLESTGSAMIETAQDDAPRAAQARTAPHLFAVLHCEAPSEGGASWSLESVDEVHIDRASEWRTERTAGLTRLLTIAAPGRVLSRKHARIVRTPEGWIVVDEGSRNGTFVNGERVQKHALEPGDVVECGRILFLFSSEPIAGPGGGGTDWRLAPDAIVPTVTPRVAALDADLRRIASSDVPVLFAGESGVGKTHVAHELHRRSGRRGALVKLEALALTSSAQLVGPSDSALIRAREGTLLLENVDRLSEHAGALLVAALEAAPDVRLVSTSVAPASALQARLPPELRMRLCGYHCDLLPVRERLGDLGLLIATSLAKLGKKQLELEVDAALALLRHPWPGNLRELAHALETAASLCAGGPARMDHLLPAVAATKAPDVRTTSRV